MPIRCCQNKFQVVQNVISTYPVLPQHILRVGKSYPAPIRGRLAGAPSARYAPGMNIVLASTSRYRRDLMTRLQIPFVAVSPGVEEAALPGEAPEAMATRLATAKALAVAAIHPGAIVIGCDQVAVSEGRILGKPGSHEVALRQLRHLSAREAVFHTALCVHNAPSDRTLTRMVDYRVKFRVLDDATIGRYLEREQPYDCAGSAKSEGLGIALIERMEGEDPNALIGLPLIALVDLLRAHGVQVP